MEITDPTLLAEIWKAAHQLYDRGFRSPYIGIAPVPIKDLKTYYGSILFRVDPEVQDMIYLMPHEFDEVNNKKENKMQKITIKEVIPGVPALVVEDEETITVYDPRVIANAMDNLFSTIDSNVEETAGFEITVFLLNHIGELLQSARQVELIVEGESVDLIGEYPGIMGIKKGFKE